MAHYFTAVITVYSRTKLGLFTPFTLSFLLSLFLFIKSDIDSYIPIDPSEFSRRYFLFSICLLYENIHKSSQIFTRMGILRRTRYRRQKSPMPWKIVRVDDFITRLWDPFQEKLRTRSTRLLMIDIAL